MFLNTERDYALAERLAVKASSTAEVELQYTAVHNLNTTPPESYHDRAAEVFFPLPTKPSRRKDADDVRRHC